MRSPRPRRRGRPRGRARILAGLAVLALATGVAWLRGHAAAGGPGPAEGLPEEAAAELQRARVEQALIRAEGTARMLRSLADVTAVSEGGS